MKLIKEGSVGLQALPAFPVVLVTVERNVFTAAAFSFCSFQPPAVMIGIKPERYSYELVCARREFGINIPGASQLEQVEQAGSISGRNGDKFEKIGLTPVAGLKIDAVLVQECPVNLECQVVSTVDWSGSHKWFIGEIVCAHIAPDYSRDQALLFWPGQYRAVGPVLAGKERIEFD